MKDFEGIKKKEFKNGLKLLMEKVPKTKKVAFLVGGMSGSVHETERVNGGSHYNEHLLFKTNKHRTAEQINKDLEYSGAIVNAFTKNECTAFFTKTLSSELDTAVDIIYEAATNFDYDEKELETERSVILTEIRMYDENHMAYTDEGIFAKTLFKDSPYEKPIGGTVKTMGEVTKKELEDFKKVYYVPNNMTIIAVGNFDEKDLVKKVESTFATLEAKELPHHDWSVSLENKTQEVIEEREAIEQIYMIMGSKIPVNHEDMFKLDAVEAILSGGLSSRLFKELREKRGIGYHASFGVHMFKEIGLIASLIAGFDPSRLDEAREVILNEYSKLKTELCPDEEFKGRLNHKVSVYEEGMENIVRRAMILFFSELRNVPYDYRDYSEHMAKVTKEDVKEAANKYLSENYVLAALAPKGFKK